MAPLGPSAALAALLALTLAVPGTSSAAAEPDDPAAPAPAPAPVAEVDPPLPDLSSVPAVVSGPASRPPGSGDESGSDEPESGGSRTPVRVALVDSGVNYTLPAIARALARGPDGVPLGRDFWDMDDRPFDRHPVGGGRIVRHGTRTASVLIAEAPRARLVPYRYPRPDMRRMRDLIAHAARNAVRVVGLPLGGNDRGEWAAFEAAAAAHPDMLFVASAGNDARDIDARPVWPASLDLDNLVVVTSADDFGALAEGVNRGRRSVDYLVPAENVPVLRFDGTSGTASGSSYAVPRLVALAARLLEAHPDWRAAELLAELRRRFADGTRPREVAGGVIPDPLAVGEAPARVIGERVIAPGPVEAAGTSTRARRSTSPSTCWYPMAPGPTPGSTTPSSGRAASSPPAPCVSRRCGCGRYRRRGVWRICRRAVPTRCSAPCAPRGRSVG